MLPCLNCFFDDSRLNTYRQGYYHSIDIFAGEEMVEGTVSGGRRVIVCSDGRSRAFGKLVGGCFGARIDGFEGEERGCLNSWEMLCTENVGQSLQPWC